MSTVNRRDVVKLAAGLAVGVSAAASLGQETIKVAKPVDDPKLEQALRNPEGFMFTEQITFKTSITEPHTECLEISPVQGSRGGYDAIHVPAGTMRLFRADAHRDDFTKQGGIYWTCGKSKGKIQFKEPGALVMVIRDMDGTVRCYSMTRDYRC